jgi:hypothetical protein
MTVRTRNRLIAFSILAAPFVFLLCLMLFWKAPQSLPVAPWSTNSTNAVYSPR